MGIMIDPDSVGGRLKGFADAYPLFFAALDETNGTFASLNTFWSGERYIEVMTAWNNTIPELNNNLKELARCSEILNAILKNYTSADNNPVSIDCAAARFLTSCEIAKDRKIKFEDYMAADELSKIKKSLQTAMSYAKTMKAENNSADWSDEGAAIDNAKVDVNSYLTHILTYLDSLSKSIEKALVDISTDFKGAGHSY